MSQRHIHPEFGQLTLLPQTSPDNPLAIDPRTRERGLQHVTEIRPNLPEYRFLSILRDEHHVILTLPTAMP